MDNEKILFKLIDDDNKLRGEINETFMSAITHNIGQMRNLIVQMVLVSIAIIGFTIPVFGTTNIVKDQRMLIGALLLLSIVVLFGFYYLTKLLSGEKKSLMNRFDTYNSYLDELVEARNAFIRDISEDSFKDYKLKQEDVLNKVKVTPMEMDKKDYGLALMYWNFFLGLVLIILSLTDAVGIAKEFILTLLG